MSVIRTLRWCAVAVFCQASAALAAETCSTVLPQEQLALTQAIDWVLCQNSSSRDTWLQIRSQQAVVAQAKSANYPTASLGASVNNTYSNGSNNQALAANAKLSWLVWDFGQRQAQQQQAEAVLAATRYSQEQTLADLSQQTITAYVAVLKAQSQIAAAKSADESALASVKAAETRWQVGTGTPLDVLQAKAAQAQTRLAVTKAESSLATAQASLAALFMIRPTHLPSLAAVELPTPELPFSEQALEQQLDIALQQRASLRSAQANLTAAEAAVSAAKVLNKPTLSLSASASTGVNDSRNQNTGVLGVAVDWPLDVGGANKAKLLQAEAQRDSKQLAVEQAKQSIEQQVWQAYYNAKAAAATLAASTDGLTSSQKAAKVALGRYQAGLGSILDVLSAQSSEAASEQQTVAARYDWLVARTQLAVALGNAWDKQVIGGQP